MSDNPLLKRELKNLKWLMKHYKNSSNPLQSIDEHFAHEGVRVSLSKGTIKCCSEGESMIQLAYDSTFEDDTTVLSYQLSGKYFEGFTNLGHCMYWHQDWFDVEVNNKIEKIL